ncbi:soj protein [Mycobacterium gordonae]|uniref:Soj protein n=1 Tax=Mycobacterium gordonae TaxID=1778 RepID=A0A0Q2UGI3_MYCGO|nr:MULTISPECIES: ParA family protein [Mycobacterium]KQH79872.1 soj protein [Mycobacterium gordonae]MDP7707142.1 ParA family protein [Mycobacterium sp. TY815]PJE05527.1 MAG: ParA family protein [Mycobacterium sp.]
MKADVIAVANHKGGVGKSFTAVSLAAGLAQGGWRTLLVDCDAQANATSMFDPDDDVDLDLYDLIADQAPVARVIRKTRIANLEIIPSTLAVAKLDQQLVMMHRREYQMAMRLEPVYEDYDAIVMDLSPNLGQLVISALNAADWMIVPTDASKWGRRGVHMFMEWAGSLRAHQVLSAELLGVLLTKYEPNTVISRDTLAALKDDGLPLFETLIPKRTAAERMVTGCYVLGDVEADPDLAQAYAAFTVDVMKRVNEGRRNRGRHYG